MKNMMIKMMAVLLVAVMLMMSAAALAEGTIRMTGNVNIRNGAGLKYAAVDTMKKGEKIDFVDTKKDERGVTWYCIRKDGCTGWISSRYAAEVKSQAAKRVVAIGDLHIRKGAGLNYASVAIAKAGQSAKYAGETKKDSRGVAWYKITANGRTGWVSSRYAKLK